MDRALTLRPALLTPLEYNPGLSSYLGVDLFVKRDDYLPGPGGGNKVRLVESILHHAVNDQSFDAVLTTGGVRSNLVRIVASVAASKGWRCSLILHGVEGESKAHLQLLRTLGAEVIVTPPDGVAGAINQSLDGLRSQGRVPLFIQGGGSTVEGALGYVEAANELMIQEKELGVRFGDIVLASGTGGTQAGLACGLENSGHPRRILGISVARPNPRGRNGVSALSKAVADRIGLERTPQVNFLDDWTFGGYERTDERLWEGIRLAGAKGGLILDPTYTGKAFVGLVDLVRSGVIAKGSSVLFWHTGGLLNLYSAIEDRA